MENSFVSTHRFPFMKEIAGFLDFINCDLIRVSHNSHQKRKQFCFVVQLCSNRFFLNSFLRLKWIMSLATLTSMSTVPLREIQQKLYVSHGLLVPSVVTDPSFSFLNNERRMAMHRISNKFFVVGMNLVQQGIEEKLKNVTSSGTILRCIVFTIRCNLNLFQSIHGLLKFLTISSGTKGN